MSPAMVEIRTPAATSSSEQLKPHLSRSEIPRQGQLFTTPSPPSDQSGIRSISDAHALGNGSGSMDRNPNEGNLHVKFAPPHPFLPSVPVSGKPSPATGLSRPRLVKLRKHSASPRVKSAVAPESGIGQIFNPFRSVSSVTDPPNREDSETQVLHDRLYTWKPFGTEAGIRVPENSSYSNSGTSESLDPSSDSFVFGSRYISNSNPKDLELGNIPGGTFSFGSKEIGNSETTTFAFRSGVKKSSNLSQDSSENSSIPNLGSFESVKSESADFVFGFGTKNDRTGNAVNNAFISTSEQGRNSDSGVFVIGGAVKKSSNSSCPNSGTSESLDPPSTSFVFGAGSISNAKSKDLESGNILGGTFSFGSKEIGDSETTTFAFGSGMKKSSNLCQDSLENSNILNLGSFESVKSESADFVFGSGIISDSSTRNDRAGNAVDNAFISTSEQGGNSDSGVFVFGGAVKNSSNFDRNSSLGSNEGWFSQLHNDMRSLKLQSIGNEDGDESNKQSDHRSKVDEKTKQANHMSKVVENNFIFGSGTISNSSTENRAFSSTSQQGRNLDSGVFVFGGAVKNSSNFDRNLSLGSNEGSFSQLPDEMRTLKLQSASNEDGYEKTKQAAHMSKVVESNFIFGGSKNVPNDESMNSGAGAFVFRSSANTNLSRNLSLGNDMKNIGRETENSVGGAAYGLAGEPTSFKFTFQAGKQGSQSQTHDHSRPSPLTTPSFHPSSPDRCFESFGTNSTFTSVHEGLETPDMVRTQKQDASCFSKENLFTRPHQNMAFSMKKGESKGTRRKNRGEKSRPSALAAKHFFSREEVSEDNPEFELPGDYSPMDYSPYQENLVADQCSREASVASNESIHIVSAAERLGINNDDLQCRELDEDGSEDHAKRNFSAESSFVVEQTSRFGRGTLETKCENVGIDSDSRIGATEAGTGSLRSNIERETSKDGMMFTSTSSLEDHGKSNYSFAAPPSVRGPISASKRHYRRKSRMRNSQDLYNSIPNDKVPVSSSSPESFPVGSTSVDQYLAQGLNGIPFVQTENNNRADINIKPEAAQESITTATASIAAQEACEKWRFRGNQAYANRHLSKAEDYYTRGVNSVSLNVTSSCGIGSLMLCYSNRAATRMSLGRFREAISDCKMAIAIDPNFLRAQVRAASCHLALGEIKDALKHFKNCLQSENVVNSDQKILIEASEGLRKAQQVADFMDQSTELLLKRTMNDVTKAMQTISEALSISPHSESLMEMKAEALLMLRNYEEVIQLCEETLDSAQMNSVVTDADGQFKDADSSGYMKTSPERLRRWCLISKSYFYMGKLEEAVEILERHEDVKTVADKYGNWSPDSSTSLLVTIRELLRLKAAGNEAFQAGRHSEAVEHYSAALAFNIESRPFVAICFCNRAAAYQALGQVTDAIADCSLAIALDASYPKAISRRATLHEMIRDYGQATNDLNRLISLLEKQLEDKDNMSATLARSTANCGDLKRARLRFSTVEEEARKETPLDMYMILGVDPSSSAADVKKAYRKAALRHHPDKAGNFFARSENIYDGLWRELADEVHMYADRLFKIIGEAYTVLSDPTKRQQYDAEEEMRATMKVYSGSSSTPRTPSDNYSSQYERSANRRQWREYESSHQRWRWSESSRSDW